MRRFLIGAGALAIAILTPLSASAELPVADDAAAPTAIVEEGSPAVDATGDATEPAVTPADAAAPADAPVSDPAEAPAPAVAPEPAVAPLAFTPAADEITADTVFNVISGDNSELCTTSWTTQAVIDTDLGRWYSNKGWEIEVTDPETGFFQMQHFTNGGDRLFWRMPIATQYAINDATLTLDFSQFDNWTPNIGSFGRINLADGTDPFTRFNGPEGYTPLAAGAAITVTTFTEDTLVVSLGDLPAGSSLVVQFTATADSAQNVADGMTYRNTATLTGEFVRGDAPTCQWMTPPVPQDGNNSAQCVVDWYAESIIDLDLQHHATTGWNWQMVDQEWGFLQVHHWTDHTSWNNSGNLFWRFPVATQYTIENAKLTVDLSEWITNWTPLLDTFIQHGLVQNQDPFTRFAGPAGYEPLAENWIAENGSVTFTEDELVIDLGTLPARSSFVTRIQGVADDIAALGNGETYTLGIRLTGDYIPGEVPGCEVPVDEPTDEPTTEPTDEPTQPTTEPTPTATPSPSTPATKPLPATGADGTGTLVGIAAAFTAAGALMLGMRRRRA